MGGVVGLRPWLTFALVPLWARCRASYVHFLGDGNEHGFRVGDSILKDPFIISGVSHVDKGLH
jgi:hypothetical protein